MKGARRQLIVRNVIMGSITALVGIGFIWYKNATAHGNAEAFCGEMLLSSQLQHIAKPVAPVGVPCKIIGNEHTYSFTGFGGYEASCVVTQSGERIVDTRIEVHN